MQAITINILSLFVSYISEYQLPAGTLNSFSQQNSEKEQFVVWEV